MGLETVQGEHETTQKVLDAHLVGQVVAHKYLRVVYQVSLRWWEASLSLQPL